ncbi:Nucleotide-binding universal stress protein, UspA family [Oryzisolibacter propanilivorax]|uniref:Nucleotide-binding universal stress protein, UspA family n=1 Tax=Oryzisolibacter propanilivorax TaxID=1527607 RepID=A0A1G9V7H1_9BURK|nr:universal stress protein [Oryzisolibacter propanilivorax]SDM68016.1 Nucleotide-binding universal stress protein, UspA family [Oryzisolibacter propanilivorax]
MLRIMIAVDGSDLALDAVHHALALVRRGGLQATLVLGHVQEEASLLELATQGADAIAEASVEAGQHLLQSALALVQAAGVPHETELGLGPVTATLVDMVERCGCDALFIGARGLGGLRGAFLGSVSQQLVEHSPVPVTVVKHAEPAEGDELDDAGAA